jgi:hypothetical protein
MARHHGEMLPRVQYLKIEEMARLRHWPAAVEYYPKLHQGKVLVFL